MTRPSPSVVAGPDPRDTTHRPFSLSLAKSQPEKSEATSDNEGDPAHPHRYRPVPDDDRPLHENPRQVKQRHHGEDHPSHKRKRFCVHELYRGERLSNFITQPVDTGGRW
jgi:hypothetical protein